MVAQDVEHGVSGSAVTSTGLPLTVREIAVISLSPANLARSQPFIWSNF
jgi:hypothetical protein